MKLSKVERAPHTKTLRGAPHFNDHKHVGPHSVVKKIKSGYLLLLEIVGSGTSHVQRYTLRSLKMLLCYLP